MMIHEHAHVVNTDKMPKWNDGNVWSAVAENPARPRHESGRTRGISGYGSVARYQRVREAWSAGSEPLAWLEDERDKRDAVIAEVDALLAALPEPPDRDAIARQHAQIVTLRDALAVDPSQARRILMAFDVKVQRTADGVRLVWPDRLRAFFSAIA